MICIVRKQLLHYRLEYYILLYRSNHRLSLSSVSIVSLLFPLSPGAAGVLVGHPFDTVKVGKGFLKAQCNYRTYLSI